MKCSLYLAVTVVALFAISLSNCQSSLPVDCGPCPMDCPFGLDTIRESDGECRCVCSASPCDKKKCPGNSVCRVKINEFCQEKSCTFFAFCTLKVKIGECPVPDSIIKVDQEECQDDLNCPGDYKCCSASSGRKACIKPCHFLKCTCSSRMEAKLVVSSRGCHSCLCVEKTNKQRSVCTLPKEVGPCKAVNKRYYYDSEARSCKQFLYGGCGGNANKFLTQELCEHSCGSVGNRDLDMKAITAIEELKPSSKNVCELEKAVGPCKSAMARFYYNKAYQRCESFNYGGCMGNKNNFGSMVDCESACAVKKLEPRQQDPCNFVSDVGPCKALLPRYYFNQIKQKCELFFYGK